MASTQHIIAIRTALKKLGYTEDVKETLVNTYTDGNTISIREMTDRQASELRNYLNGVQKQEDDTANKMRKKGISKYWEMGCAVWSDDKQKMIADMPRIKKDINDKWHKDLNDYTITELAKIITVLEKNILPWYYGKLNEEGE